MVICQTNNFVQHYRTIGQTNSILLNSLNPAIGLNKTAINTINGWFVCEFTREISRPSQEYYFDLRNQYFILNAFGNMDSSGI